MPRTANQTSFRPGHAGQPGKKRLAAADLVAELTDGGRLIFEKLVDILCGKPIAIPTGQRDDNGNELFEMHYPDHRDVTLAARLLLERRYGAAPKTLEVNVRSVANRVDLKRLPPAELVAFMKGLQTLEASGALPAGEETVEGELVDKSKA